MLARTITHALVGLETRRVEVEAHLENGLPGFAIVGRLFLQAYGLFCIVLFPLWPAYGEAFRRGDLRWVTGKLRGTL